MNLRTILFLVSLFVTVITLGMFSAVGVAWYYGEDICQMRLLWCACCCLFLSILGGVNYYRDGFRPFLAEAGVREGFASVALAWVAAIVLGALPFVICAKVRFVDAVFETASGFSTTGASVLDLNEMKLPQCIHYWRCLLNWLGGIGFVMFILLVLPLRRGGKQLYNAEVPGLKSASEQLTPRIKTTAMLLLGTYVAWTALVMLGYDLLGMGHFDAICHGFTTVSTGGFSPHAESFAYFSPLLQWASIVFMFVSACNFALHVKVFYKRQFDYWKDEEFLWFLGLTVGSGLVVALFLAQGSGMLKMLNGNELARGWELCLRTSLFHIVSMMTTTGYATSDFCYWGVSCLPILFLLLMTLGGCAGSTAGGMKIGRGLVLVKQTQSELRRRIAPHVLPDVRISGGRVEMEVVNQTMAFLVIYLLTAGICCILLTFLEPGISLSTAGSAAISAISNVGPGFGKLSPSYTWGWMCGCSKLLLAFTMVAGRLELYTVFVVLMPRFWRIKTYR